MTIDFNAMLKNTRKQYEAECSLAVAQIVDKRKDMVYDLYEAGTMTIEEWHDVFEKNLWAIGEKVEIEKNKNGYKDIRISGKKTGAVEIHHRGDGYDCVQDFVWARYIDGGYFSKREVALHIEREKRFCPFIIWSDYLCRDSYEYHLTPVVKKCGGMIGEMIEELLMKTLSERYQSLIKSREQSVKLSGAGNTANVGLADIKEVDLY